MNDEQAMNATLDLDPTDIETRLILSDLLEETGRLGEAEDQRWLVRRGAYPSYTQVYKHRYGEKSWDWWKENSNNSHVVPAASLITQEEWDGLAVTNGNYPIRSEAEADLIASARRDRSDLSTIIEKPQ